MTHSDVDIREAEREGSAPGGAAPESTAETRAPARDSVTQPASVALQAVTDSARAVRCGLASAAARMDRAGSLIHAQPPTFAQAWARHLECARHYETAMVRWPRTWWGVVHVLAVMPVLYLLAWITESPARYAVAGIIAAAIWYWS